MKAEKLMGYITIIGLFATIMQCFNTPFFSICKWLLIALVFALVAYYYFKQEIHWLSVIIFIVGVVFFAYLFMNDKQEDKAVLASGQVKINLERIVSEQELEKGFYNQISKIECESASLRNLDNDFVYSNYKRKGNMLIFDDVRVGQYELKVKVKDNDVFTIDINYDVSTLTASNNAMAYEYKILKFVKYDNPVWGDWGEWSEWQEKRIDANSKTDVETRISGSLGKEVIGQMKIEYQDENKPIYGKRQVKVGTRTVMKENGESVEQDVYGTIDVVVGYDKTTESKEVYYFSDDDANVQYRYRTRKMLRGEESVVYAVENIKQYLLDLGYEIDSLYLH